MKTSKLIYTVLMFIPVTFLISCNDDFMERYPKDEITDDTFWSTGEDLEVYNNQLYAENILGFGSEWDQVRIAPYGYLIARPYHDNITDNGAPKSYSKVAANEYNDYVSEGSGSGGWDWDDIRSFNFFIENYERVDAEPEEKKMYLGEVLFFKARSYFKKVKTFGEVPWLNEVLDVESEALMDSRMERDELLDSIMDNLNQAIEYLPEKGEEKPDRLNKDMALFLKSRLGLYEGTYRKYHGLDNYQYFLEASVEASERLMGGDYSLYSTGDTDKDYYSLFSQYAYDDNPEAILWKEYSEDESFGVSFSRYYTSMEVRDEHGATRDLVDTYLSKDGLPISNSPYFKGKDSIQLEMENRDPRLNQTIANVGAYQNQDGVEGSVNAPYPNLPGTGATEICPTGYRVAKWWLDDPEDWDRTTLGQQADLIFRYGEVLLNYAEDKYELGQLNQSDIDETINKLRDRVGMPGLDIDNVPDDPELDGIYSEYASYNIDPLLREIRRERRVELAFEGFRWDDLVRWKVGEFLEKPVLGMKFVQDQFPNVVVDSDIFLDEDGFIMPYAQDLPDGRKWEDQQYLFPIPIEDLVLNPNLEQNPGWDSN